MTYDVNVLKTVEECQVVLERAKATNADFHKLVFKRLAQLEEEKYDDPLEAAFQASLLVSEQVRTELNGRKTRSTRVRNAIKVAGGGVGVITQMFEKWALGPEKSGFQNLSDVGMLEFTAEHIVAHRFPERFSEDAVTAAKIKLAKHND